MENRTILQKADLALSELQTSAGYLQPAQAQSFMEIMIEGSQLLQSGVTVVPMAGEKQRFERIGFLTRVLRRATDGVALSSADRVKPDLGKGELSAVEMKATCRLTKSELEDNIEGGQFLETVKRLLGKAVSRDFEDVIINGDTASSDSLLASFDGILKQATTNVVDDGVQAMSRAVGEKLMRLMPPQFQADRSGMRFFTSFDAELKLRSILGDRATGIGDQFITQNISATLMGVPIVAVPLFPQTLGVGSNETNVLYTNPENIMVGIHRNIEVESDKDIEAGVYVIVISLRADAKLQYEPAAAKAVKITA